MSNDDLGLRDLSPNIIDDWEFWASDRPERVREQDANDRKIIALCRAVRTLRAEKGTCPACRHARHSAECSVPTPWDARWMDGRRRHG